MPPNRSQQHQHNGDGRLTSLETIDATDLLNTEFPEPRWIVPGILPEGFTIIAGRPKIGKSFLMLGAAIALVQGGMVLGSIAVEQGECLYLALEDSKRRLKKRLHAMLGGASIPSGLEIATECPRLDSGGRGLIEDWLAGHRSARLVVIDTWQKVRPKRNERKPLYEDDYEATTFLKQIADEHNIAVVAVHHYRKGNTAEDWLDDVSGSTGFTAVADTIIGIRKERAQADAIMYITGRDVEDAEKALKFDGATGAWTLLGDASEYRGSKARQDIITALRDNPSGKLSPSQIGKIIGKTANAVQLHLNKMLKDGTVTIEERGLYRLATPQELGLE